VYRRVSALAALTVAATVAGFIRETTIAYRFGTSIYADALAIAVFLFDCCTSIFLVGGFGLAFVPAVTARRQDFGDADAVGLVAAAGTWLFALTAVVAAIGLVAAPFVVEHAFRPDSPARVAATIGVLRGALPSLVIYAVATGIGAGLYGLDLYNPAALGRVAWNAGIAGTLVVAGGVPPVTAITLGLLVGSAAFAVPPLAALARVGARMRPRLRHQALVPLLRTAAPGIVLISASTILLGSWERFLLAGLSVGSIATVYYALRASQIASTVSLAFHTAAFGDIAKAARPGGDRDAAARLIARVFRQSLLVIVPLACFMAIDREPIIAVLFGRGAFSASAVVATGRLFGIYATATVPVLIVGLVVRVLYAASAAWSGMIVLILASIIAGAVDWSQLARLGEAAIPVGYLVGMVASVIIGAVVMERRLQRPVIRDLTRTLLVSGSLCVVAAGACFAVRVGLVSIGLPPGCSDRAMCAIGRLAVDGPVYVTAFAVTGIVCNVREIRSAAAWMKQWRLSSLRPSRRTQASDPTPGSDPIR